MKTLKYKDEEGNWLSMYNIYKPKEDEYVDLGLPSGLLWATCNIGANSPEEAGLYFHWAGIEGITAEQARVDDYYKIWCSWENTPYSKGTGTGSSSSACKLTKYCNSTTYGNEGFADKLITLEPMDDAATLILGDSWRMPTSEEITELLNNTTNSWVTNYKGTGINGILFNGKNSYSNKELFVPAYGNVFQGGLGNVGFNSYLWSSSFNTYNANTGRCLFASSSSAYLDDNYRFRGCPIRGVKSKN